MDQIKTARADLDITHHRTIPTSVFADDTALLAGWTGGEAAAGPMGFATPGRKRPRSAAKPGEAILISGEGHLMTIAPTGSGKGVACVIPALLSYAGPMIVIDPKGENAAVTADRRRAMGQCVHVVDPLGISGQKSSRFNPLDLIDTKYADATDDASMLATLMVPRNERDLFWSDRAVQLITGAMLHICATEPRSGRDLAAVRALIGEAVSKPVTVGNRLKRSPHDEARAASSMLIGDETRVRHSILSVTLAALDLFRGECVANAMAASDFSIEDVTRGKPLTIYLVLPPHLLESHAPVLRMWVASLFAALSRRSGQPERATLLLLDEAAQLGDFAPLRTALTLLRSYGVRTWSFWQDVSQIQRLYPDWQTLVNNCAAVQAFGAPNPLAAASVAEILGQADSKALLDMASGDLALRRQGEDVRIVRRPDYRYDACFRDLSAPNPFYSGNAQLLRARRPARLTGSLCDDTQLDLFRDENSDEPGPEPGSLAELAAELRKCIKANKPPSS